MKASPLELNKPRKRSLFSLRLFILVMLIGGVAPFAYAAVARFYSHYAEVSAPIIEIVSMPRGIGTAPVTLKFRLKDMEAGLDEVIVRVRQRGRSRELLKTKLKGQKLSEHEISFEGAKSTFQEGPVEFEIVAFDRAFWSNRAQKDFQLRADYHKPKVEVLTTQHNARRGGSQLVFYRAIDEEVGMSGVRVGSRVFQGFRAQGLDPAFEDNNLYIAFYAIDLAQELEGLSIKVFVEDMVGNSASTDFYNKVLERTARQTTLPLSDELLRIVVPPLLSQEAAKLASYAEQAEPLSEGEDALLRNFTIANEVLKPLNQKEIATQLEQHPRFESFLKNFFLRQGGTTRIQFGDRISYVYQDRIISSDTAIGTEFTLPQNQQEIMAVNDGIVSVAENQGTYGRLVVLDHGLGVSSVYAHLGQLKVAKGDQVKRGDSLGVVGASGLAFRPAVNFEMRVHGVPVDPLEWWDANWFNQHVIGKIEDMKRLLGLGAPKPLTLGNSL